MWDDREMVKRIWERCLLGEGVARDLGVLEGRPEILGDRAVRRGDK
jgi:hypothetical protein